MSLWGRRPRVGRESSERPGRVPLGRPGRVPGTRARGPVPERPRHVRQIGAVLGVLGLLAAVAAAPHASDFTRRRAREAPFLLEHVSARGLSRVPVEEIAAALGVERDTPLIDLDVAAVEARLAAHPWVAEASAARVPPSSLRVSVRERVPLAVTEAGHPARLHAVDETGTAFAPASSEDVSRLLAVILPAPAAVGAPDPNLLEALRLAAALRERGLEVPRELRLGVAGRAESAELRLRGFAPAIWLELGQGEAQLDRLATLLSASLATTAHAAVVDLRFEGRAVLRSTP